MQWQSKPFVMMCKLCFPVNLFSVHTTSLDQLTLLNIDSPSVLSSELQVCSAKLESDSWTYTRAKTNTYCATVSLETAEKQCRSGWVMQVIVWTGCTCEDVAIRPAGFSPLLLLSTLRWANGGIPERRFNKLWVYLWTLSWLTLRWETLSIRFQNSWSALVQSTLSMFTLS